MCLLREKDKPHSSTPNDAMVEYLKWCYICKQEAILSSSFYWYKRIPFVKEAAYETYHLGFISRFLYKCNSTETNAC